MINIEDITPFMRKGWVAMDSNGTWMWYSRKPVLRVRRGKFVYIGFIAGDLCSLSGFDIAPAEDWTNSLIRVGDNPKNKVFDVDEYYKEMFEND